MEIAPTESRTSLERIPQKKRVVVMLGARMYPGTDNLVFPLTLPFEQRPHESVVARTSGGFARMRAVQGEFQKSLTKGHMITLVTGGQEKGIGSRAEEAARALVERYGLPEEDVISIGGKGSTLGNAAATVDFLRTHAAELGDVTAIEIVTNEYHMLRSWIMFSSGILESEGTKLEITPRDLETIRSCLEENEHMAEPAMIQETRASVMRILEPYFAGSRIRVVPVVAEEMFALAGSEGDATKERYAQRLRGSRVLPEVVRSEYKGIIDLLEGRYKGRL